MVDVVAASIQLEKRMGKHSTVVDGDAAAAVYLHHRNQQGCWCTGTELVVAAAAGSREVVSVSEEDPYTPPCSSSSSVAAVLDFDGPP